MTHPAHIVLHRKNKKSKGVLPFWGKWFTWVISILLLVFLGSAFVAGLVYVHLTEDLPPVGNIETMFTGGEKDFLEPIQVYDRSHKWMFDLLHPITSDRQWMSVEQTDVNSLPKALLDAMVIAHDKTFWTNQGYDSSLLVRAIIGIRQRAEEPVLTRSITQKLVQMTILPSDDFLKPDLWRYLREALLAQKLSQHYTKNQILEWYINSVGFGSMTYGADAAALLYFDKHANQLTLAECVMLAAISAKPMEDPFDVPEQVQENETKILQSMVDQGLITVSQSQKAQLEGKDLLDQAQTQDTDLQRYTMDRMIDTLGVDIADRAGLYVFTTIDSALQKQVDCAIKSLASGLYGQAGDLSDDLSMIEGCSGLVPTLTIGEENGENELDEFAGLILDTHNGEVLSLYGPADRQFPSTSILYPFIYLTAFSRGSSPGTMVLDLPMDDMDEERFEGTTSHGPVLMQKALAGGYPFAVHRIIQTIGLENILQVMGQMGVSEFYSSTGMFLEGGFPEQYEISLSDATYSYGILANSGKMVGAPAISSSNGAGRSLDPIFISDIMDQAGRSLYRADRGEQSIVSQELSFLLTDTLTVSAAEMTLSGRSDVFEFEQSPALVHGINQTGDLSWTVGYTPSRAVGVWTQRQSNDVQGALDVSWNSSMLWYALMNLGMQDVPLENWQQPQGVHQVEICEPSGLLPTKYCRSLVKEYFISGTEPIHYDTFFMPFQINKETGKLATLFTPIDLVTDEVFFVPPPEAMEWAGEAGYLQPPEEYDTIDVPSIGEDDIRIDIPQNFDYIRAEKWISGRTKVDGFSTYLLQYGEGLNPTQWFRIGEIQSTPVVEGTLALWDTSDLDGLYALQLIVVDHEGIAYIDTKYVTVDNENPEVELLCPETHLIIRLDIDQSFSCEVQAEDNIGISKVEFYFNERRIDIDRTPPFEIHMGAGTLQDGMLYARVYDLAGNVSQSEPVQISIDG